MRSQHYRSRHPFTALVAATGLLLSLNLAVEALAGGADINLRGPKKIVADPKPVDFKVNYVYRRQGRGKLHALIDGGTLHSGDHYKIQFTPEEDSFVYIFQVDSSSTVFPLFPMRSFKQVMVDNRNPVRAGQIYSIPATDKSFELDLTVGVETVYFFAFRQPNAEIERILDQVRQDLRQPDNGQQHTSLDKLRRIVKTRGPARIVRDAVLKTEVVWDRQERFAMPVLWLQGLCSTCVSKVAFTHR